MAHWKKRFPSTYLAASDLDVPMDVTIAGIKEELIGIGAQATTEPVLYFREKSTKPCILNKTRGRAVEAITGTWDDVEWSGKRIRLQKGMTTYLGKPIECIDVVAPPALSPRKPPKGKVATEPEPEETLPGTDDEEPF